MRLREHAIYIKLVSRIDGINEGVFVDTVRQMEALSGAPFEEFRDLGGTRLPPKPMSPSGERPYDRYVGMGFHPTVRFSLHGPGLVRSVSFNAGLHPYSGVYVVQLDARVDAQSALSSPEPIREAARQLVDSWNPLTLHVHDVDDDAIQNIDNPRLLELGYGIRTSVELEARPGREASRGQFRFAVNWVTYFGDETLNLLGLAERESWPVTSERLPVGRLFLLAESPTEIGSDAFRDRQRALRTALNFDALIEEDRRSFSYWKRKP